MIKNTEVIDKDNNSILKVNSITTETLEESNIFTLEVLRIIKELQQQHGLRHGDFQRYRGYCTRKLKRLRKALNLPQGGKHFKKRDVSVHHLEKKESNEKFIQIPLIQAERAWAFGMQLRQEANSEPRKKFHLISRMKKACVYSSQLQDLVNNDFCDARTKLEIKAYNCFMHGTLYFEQNNWKEAAENFKRAQIVYENLIKTLPEEEQILYKTRIDEFGPSLRYCSYNIGESDLIDEIMMHGHGMLDNLSTLIAQSKTEQTDSFQFTEWRNRKVAIRPQKVRIFLISIQDLDKSIKNAKNYQDKIDIIENVLIDCKDSILAVKEEIKLDPKLRKPMQEGQISSVAYLLSYLSYIRLKLTLERNLYLIAQAKQNFDDDKSNDGNKKIRPQDISRLYEIILQNIAELQQLSGLEDDKEYHSEIENLSQAFKAFRCYYVALTLVNLKRWKEAVAMYERSTNYALEALKYHHITEFDLKEELFKLIKNIEGSKFSAHARSVLETGKNDVETALYGGGKVQKKLTPLYDRLNFYKEDSALNSRTPNVYNLTNFEMNAIPCKPLFFDLALNFIEFPSLNDKTETPSKKQAGFSGFVKGFLGFSSEKK